MRQAQCDLPPGFDQLDEGIFYYCKTDTPGTRRSHTRDQDLQVRLAEKMGVSYPRVNELIHGKLGVTPDTALRLEQLSAVKEIQKIKPLISKAS